MLDDYQRAATTVADRSAVADAVDVVSFDTHVTGEDALAAALADVDILVTLRERVPFPGSLIARLPRLRLIVASGMRNSVIDYAAAEAHGGLRGAGAGTSQRRDTGPGRFSRANSARPRRVRR